MPGLIRGYGDIATSASWSKEEYAGRLLLFTPSLSLGYKDYFSVQGGVQMNVAVAAFTTGDEPSRSYPFVTAGANLARMIKPESAVGLKLFGSYAKTAYWGEVMPSLEDLSLSNGTGSDYSHLGLLNNASDAGESWQTGLNLQLFGNCLQVGYNYDHKLSEGVLMTSVPIPGGGYSPIRRSDFELRFRTHRIGVIFTGTETADFNWRTGLNAATTDSHIMKLSGSTPGGGIITPGGSVIILDAGMTPPGGGMMTLPVKRIWKGGWLNHFGYKKLTAGFNVLYNLNDRYTYTTTYPGTFTEIAHTFVLQHVYLGYRFTIAGSAQSELYASGRNLLQSDKLSLAIGEFRYYGLGVKVGW